MDPMSHLKRLPLRVGQLRTGGELFEDDLIYNVLSKPRAGRVVRPPNVHRTFTPSLVAEALAKASQLRPGGELFEDIFRINEYTHKRITI